MRHLLVLFLGFNAVRAFSIPFSWDFFGLGAADSLSTEVIPLKIAVVGAGAAGSSAAFWISKARERLGVQVQVDVYEREGYVGGRSTTVYPYNDVTLDPVELGASIFVKGNKNLWRATDEFNLERINFHDDSAPIGFWDGEQIVFTTSGRTGLLGWWDTFRAILRYGVASPQKTESIVQSMSKQMDRVYVPERLRWSNISEVARDLGWAELAAQTAAEFLDTQGVSKRFSREIVEAATRCNYGQDLDYIHAVGGAASMAASGPSSVKGGNRQIFEQFLMRSNANLFLNTPVLAITDSSSSAARNSWTVTTAEGSSSYDAVIIAAPFHSTGITLQSQSHDVMEVPPQPYIHLHVTLLSTTSPHPNPEYFSLPAGSDVPTMILTTFEGARQGGSGPEFNSLTYHGRTAPGSAEWVVKIFSKARVSDGWLNRVFDGKVGWVYRKEWDSYPKLTPTSEFPPVKLSDGVYYVNAFEPFISTMETETVAARNIVDIIFRERFWQDICGNQVEVEEEEEGILNAQDQVVLKEEKPEAKSEPDEKFVYGWDC